MTVNEVKPFGDRILVRPDPKLEMSDGGLHIPETVRADNPNYYTMTGIVVALGDGVREDVYRCHNRQCGQEWRRTANERCPACSATMGLVAAEGRHAFDVAIGDRVLFGRFAGKQIEAEELWMFHQETRPSPHGQWREPYGDCIVPYMPLEQYDRRGWMDETQGQVKIRTVRFLIMREVEVLGIVDAGARVQPGYVPASWNRPQSWKDDPAMVRGE